MAPVTRRFDRILDGHVEDLERTLEVRVAVMSVGVAQGADLEQALSQQSSRNQDYC